jgi:hypothetical protein
MAAAGPGRPVRIADGISNATTFAEAIDRFCPDGLGPAYTGLDDVTVVGMRRAKRLT